MISAVAEMCGIWTFASCFVVIYTVCRKNGVYYTHGQNQHCDR